MPYVIERVEVDAGAEPIAGVYRAVGFRPDLIDDVLSAARLGGAVFVARSESRAESRAFGVSSCLPFGGSGWVGGVAVLPEARRSGLGRALTQRAVDALHDGGAVSICLHATPMARPLYESMGFVPEAELVELTGPALNEKQESVPGLRPGRSDDLVGVLALDAAVTGENRSALLRGLWPRHGWVMGAERIDGYCLRQLESAAGAVIAQDPDAGRALLATALGGRHGHRGLLRVPTPLSRTDVISWLGERGFRQTSSTTRMHLGTAPAWRDQGLVSAFNLYWG